MPTDDRSLHLPSYQLFIDSIATLSLPLSASNLHGIMCGYLCAGAVSEGEAYLRALIPDSKDKGKKVALIALFGVFAVSHQQIVNFNFEFQLLLPDEEETLFVRAQAFSEWCQGFMQAIEAAGIDSHRLHEEEAKDALQHFLEFAELDYEALEMNEDDERALVEVSEYARMAVLNIYTDIQASKLSSDEVAH